MTDHQQFAEALRRRLTEAAAETSAADRSAAFAVGGGVTPTDTARDALAHQIGRAAAQVTDDQVAAVRAGTGSDKATFEIVMSAAIGAGLSRWDRAMAALAEAKNASP